MSAVIRILLLAVSAQAAEPDSIKALQILTANCAQCHSKAMAMSALDLSTRESLLKGGSRGPAAIPGRSADSKLIQAVEGKNKKLSMPLASPLAAADIEVLRRWIDQGAVWPEKTMAHNSTASKW